MQLGDFQIVLDRLGAMGSFVVFQMLLVRMIGEILAPFVRWIDVRSNEREKERRTHALRFTFDDRTSYSLAVDRFDRVSSRLRRPCCAEWHR